MEWCEFNWRIDGFTIVGTGGNYAGFRGVTTAGELLSGKLRKRFSVSPPGYGVLPPFSAKAASQTGRRSSGESQDFVRCLRVYGLVRDFGIVDAPHDLQALAEVLKLAQGLRHQAR
jgi:hypothetical protein